MSPVQLPYTVYSQRVPFYQDVMSLIDPGFLSQHVTINGIPLSIRTPYPSDYLLAENYSTKDDSSLWVARFLSLCTWNIDNQVLNDLNVSRIVFEGYRSMKDTSIVVLFHILKDLVSRLSEAIQDVSVFCLEEQSRLMWEQYGKDFASIFTRKNILPYQELNAVQKIWIYQNRFRDFEQETRIQWSFVKTLLSPHAPKGVQSLSSQDKAKNKKEEAEKRILRDELYYKKIGVLGPEGFPDRNRRLTRKKSYNELADEYKRWVRGEMDEHDLAVKEYKERIKKAWKEREELKEKRRKQLQDLREAENLPDEKEQFKMVAYSGEQLEKILKHRKPHRGSKIIDVPGSSYIYKGWVENDPSPPPKSLQEQVSSRPVSFKLDK